VTSAAESDGSKVLSGPLRQLRHLDAYLARIGHDGPLSLAALHRAHATSIPFDNLDASDGRPVALEPDKLEDKLVARRRGGYCFEQNLLLMAALESVDVELVEPMLARVRSDPTGEPGPLDHLVLRVVEHGEAWLADVGFGGGGLLDPIPFEVGAESEQSGWRYRIAADGAAMVVQVHQDDAWSSLYRIVPEPVPIVDIEVSNWFISTHPSSPMVAGVIAGARHVDRTLTFFHFHEPTFVERLVGQPATTTVIAVEDVPALFTERLGIEGVTVNADGRPTRSA
jgi:N-hydroxyarylamine O-acetyltransferase